MRVVWTIWYVVGCLCLGSATAEARSRSQREGLNFGTTFRIMDTADRSFVTDDNDRSSKVEGSSVAVNPYIGYAFGSFNLGLIYHNESRTSQSTEISADGLTTTNRESSLQGRGGSLYARFLFANVFFFEGGAGIYKQTTRVKSETKTPQGGNAFTGEEDAYEIEGIGPGYHVGGGLELPMSNGFFFTSCYQVRIVQLRDHFEASDLGRKRSQNQKREVLFGIAYYDR